MYIIYSRPACTYCDRAKDLLKSRGLEYKEISIDIGQPKVEGVEYCSIGDLRQVVPGAKTVPQIFEDLEYVGGYDALIKRFPEG